MPHQNAGAGDSILVMIALVSMVVFILMLFASFVIVHPIGRTESQAGPKKEHRSSLAAAVRARLFSPDRPKRELTARQRAILEILKTLNWAAYCIIASFVAFAGYDRVQHNLLSVFQIPDYYYWTAHILAIVSPTCVGVAWLRFTGVGWRKALGLFLFVPVGAFIIWYMINILPYMIAN